MKSLEIARTDSCRGAQESILRNFELFQETEKLKPLEKSDFSKVAFYIP